MRVTCVQLLEASGLSFTLKYAVVRSPEFKMLPIRQWQRILSDAHFERLAVPLRISSEQATIVFVHVRFSNEEDSRRILESFGSSVEKIF